MTFTADLHSHSHYSDGKQTPLIMYQRAQELGLNYFALTDHNTVKGVLELEGQLTTADLKKTKLVPGFELSLLSGHWLVLGLETKLMATIIAQWRLHEGAFADLVSDTKALEIFAWVKENNGILIAAHPCVPTRIMSASTKTVAMVHEKGLLHGMEIHNHDALRKLGPLYDYWHLRAKTIAEKLQIPAFANSDAHTVDRLGMYYNYIKVSGKADLVLSLRAKQGQMTSGMH